MPSTPFLCNFVDKVWDNSDTKHSIDFREFLTTELGLFPKNHQFSKKCVLILSRHADPEADVVCIELLRRGIDYVRIFSDDILRSLIVYNRVDEGSEAECKIKIDSRIINLSDISAVWLRDFDYSLIYPNSYDLNTAFIFQQWSDALQILYDTLENGWLNSLEATYRANNRARQLAHAKQIGFNIPATLITNDPKMARRFYRDHNKNIILKVLHHHDIEVNSKVYSIYSHSAAPTDIPKFDDLIHAPSLLQESIDKCSELRVTVVGDKVFSVLLELKTLTSRQDDMHRIPLSKFTKKSLHPSKEFEKQCIKLLKSFGLEYGTIDFVTRKDGKLFFLEINPTGDWLWIERHTRTSITCAVVDLLEDIARKASDSS